MTGYILTPDDIKAALHLLDAERSESAWDLMEEYLCGGDLSCPRQFAGLPDAQLAAKWASEISLFRSGKKIATVTPTLLELEAALRGIRLFGTVATLKQHEPAAAQDNLRPATLSPEMTAQFFATLKRMHEEEAAARDKEPESSDPQRRS